MGGLIATLRKPLAIARVARGGGAGPYFLAALHVHSKLAPAAAATAAAAAAALGLAL